MSIYKPQKSRFFHYDFVIQGQRLHGSTGQVTLREAERAERRIRAQVADGSYGSAENVTLDEACGRWWDDVGQHRGDAVDVERRLGVLITLIGAQIPLNSIDADVVAGAIRTRRETPYVKSKADDARKYFPSPATVNRDIV